MHAPDPDFSISEAPGNMNWLRAMHGGCLLVKMGKRFTGVIYCFENQERFDGRAPLKRVPGRLGGEFKITHIDPKPGTNA